MRGEDGPLCCRQAEECPSQKVGLLIVCAMNLKKW